MAAGDGSAEETVLAAERVVTPTAVLEPGTVVVRGPRIEAVEAGVPDDAAVDARGELLLPGLVDLHGDDVESHLFPREGARAPTASAVHACDRTNVAAGVTTKFHAVAFEETPRGDRSVETARELLDVVPSLGGLLGDHHVHARCEVGNDDCVTAVADAVDREAVRLVSLMNHCPGEGQFADRAAFRRRYAGADAGAVERLVEGRQSATTTLTSRARHLAARAGEADVVVASHDDDSPEAVDVAADLGADVSEFPLSLAAARRATERGLVTALGAPNLVRGGSLWDNLAVREAVREGLVDVLCTDYRPSSLLESVFVDTGEPLTERVARVSATPAAAVGLDDRGRIRPGARADLLFVGPGQPPVVERVIAGGTTVVRTPGQ